MDEYHELGAELYEAMMDHDITSLNETVKKINKSMSDIKKSFQENEL